MDKKQIEALREDIESSLQTANDESDWTYDAVRQLDYENCQIEVEDYDLTDAAGLDRLWNDTTSAYNDMDEALSQLNDMVRSLEEAMSALETVEELIDEIREAHDAAPDVNIGDSVRIATDLTGIVYVIVLAHEWNGDTWFLLNPAEGIYEPRLVIDQDLVALD